MHLSAYGPEPEDAYTKCKNMVMTGKPSTFLKALINTACEKYPDLQGCCAGGMISGMWREKLPAEVRQQVAGQSIFGKEAMKSTLQTADAVYSTLQSLRSGGAAVSAVSADLDTSADAPALQLAAFQNKNRQNNRNFRKNNPATSNATKSATKPKSDRGDLHPDGPPTLVCNTHWKYGKAAFRCQKEETCPWAKYVNK